MDANVCDKDHNPTNCYLTVTTRIVFDRAAEKNAGHHSDVCPAAAKLPDFAASRDEYHNCGKILMEGRKDLIPMV
jgi:hypothetical protein